MRITLDRSLFRGHPDNYREYLRYAQQEAEKRQQYANAHLYMWACEKRLGGHQWGLPSADGRDMGARCKRCGTPEHNRRRTRWMALS